MNKTLTDLFREAAQRFGVVQSLVIPIVLAIIIWTLAHFAAAPGTEVKVLWGLVEYTKRTGDTLQSSGNDEDEQNKKKVSSTKPLMSEKDSIEQSVSTEPRAAVNSKKPVNLVVHYGLSEDVVVEKVEQLRSKYTLKGIRTINSDKQLSDSTPSTYSFVTLLDLNRELRRGKPLRARSHKSNQMPGFYIEVHHRKRGTVNLIAFVPESEADRIKNLDGKTEYKVTIAPKLWKNFSTIVELPISRILGSSVRWVSDDDFKSFYILDLQVK